MKTKGSGAGEDTHSAGVIWIAGYSGAGKTTVARHVRRRLDQRNVPSVLLDGDELRSIYGGRWGYERDDRIALGFVNHRLCSYLCSQGLTVIIAAGGMYREVLSWMRNNVPHAIQVYLQVDEKERLRRDAATKGVYQKIKNIGALFDDIGDPDLVIENCGSVSPEEAAERIVSFYLSGVTEERALLARRQSWEDHYRQRRPGQDRTPSSFAGVVAASLTPGSSIIDVGCGAGADLRAFAAKGARVTGLDPSAVAVAKCRENGGEGDIDIIHGAVEELNREGRRGGFNDAYCRSVLNAVTVREEAEIVRGVYTALKADGHFWVECISVNDARARSGEVLGPAVRLQGRYVRFIDQSDLIDTLVGVGFVVESALDLLAEIEGEMRSVLRLHARKPLVRS